MCLSTVIEKNGAANEALMNNVSRIAFHDGEIELEDIMGRRLSFKGDILDVDFIQNTVVVCKQ
mgnify:CR=1 FL=1